jgi:hypothetical protein
MYEIMSIETCDTPELGNVSTRVWNRKIYNRKSESLQCELSRYSEFRDDS